jgi:hypothetical protein
MNTTLTTEDENLIIKYEKGLHEHGLAYLTICGNSEISQLVNHVKQEKYEQLDSWIREYSHNEFVECSWTGKKIYDPVQQLINRFQNYNKYGDDNGDNGKKFNIGIVSTDDNPGTKSDNKSDTKLDVKIESDIPNIKIESGGHTRIFQALGINRTTLTSLPVEKEFVAYR